ncbi:hypothetical protein AB4274_20365 [Vibrio sp. 10N.261.55.A10]|uniref:hypothetical protein n=1 Tax=Vibrio sp. 10N.261.55.A10 TaxID=3229687 RepID=UPI0035500604
MLKILFILLLMPLHAVAEWNYSNTEQWTVTKDKLFVESMLYNAAAQVFFVDGQSYVRVISATDTCSRKGDKNGERNFVASVFADEKTINEAQPVNMKSICISEGRAVIYPVSDRGHQYILNLLKVSQVISIETILFSAKNFTSAYNQARTTSLKAL